MTYLVAPVMGTTVSIDVRDETVPASVLEAAVATLRELEARFTTFRDDSEVQRLSRGELTLADVHPDVREVLDACAILRAESGGAFDAWRDGHLDPSGYVKGWAGSRAADVLRAGGARRFAVNIGGDIACAGGPSADKPWRVGVRLPEDATRVAFVLGMADGAVATSGLYERRGHVVDARTGAVPNAWRSITVMAPDLATADAVATAALAMGEGGPAWAAARPTCDVAAIRADGRLWTTPGIERSRLA